jgi:hypothetical protein
VSTGGSTPPYSLSVPPDVRVFQKLVGGGVILAWVISIWFAFPFVMRLYRVENKWTFNKPAPPLQMGIMTTTSSVTGWRNYAQKSRFFPGERLCVYAEALNVNKNGQISLSYTFTAASSMGNEIYRQNVPTASSTTSPSWAAYPCFNLPSAAQAGTYVARASIYDALSKRTGESSVQFAVTMRKTKKKVTRAPQKKQ